MRWIKKGLIFSAQGNFGWMNSHAQVPTVLNLGKRLRIFFSTRTVPNFSRIAFLDVSAKNPAEILYIHQSEVLTPGSPGSFDEHGIMPSSVLIKDHNTYLFYSGWSRRTSVPYSNLSGLAISSDTNGLIFSRAGDGPVLTTNLTEPYSATSPFIFFENGTFYAYYCSGLKWLLIDGKYEHVYDIKLATSQNATEWNQCSYTCVSQSNYLEAITRPTVIKLRDKYHMWFCYRGSTDFRNGQNSYKIGYAYSFDRTSWVRNDIAAGIETSSHGWDSKMVAYPYVISTDYGIYMFYNGNGFGESGFGYAVLETI